MSLTKVFNLCMALKYIDVRSSYLAQAVAVSSLPLIAYVIVHYFGFRVLVEQPEVDFSVVGTDHLVLLFNHIC